MCSWHTEVASSSLAVGTLSIMWTFALGLWVQGLSQEMAHLTQDPDTDAGVRLILHVCPTSMKLVVFRFLF